MSDDSQIREQAKALGIRNYHNKKIETLRQEVLDAMSAGVTPHSEVDVEASIVAKKEEIRKQEADNKAKFAMAEKGENLYPFVTPKGDRVGLFRKKAGDNRRNNDVWGKDSSFEFVRWN